jgi:hypothetical protein
MMAAVIRESAPVAASQERARVAASSRGRRSVRGRFFRTRVVAVLAAGLLLVGGGLAFAGVLPAPLQNGASHVLHRIGLHVPEHVAPAVSKPPVTVPSNQEPAHPSRNGHETAPSGGGSHGRTRHTGSGIHGGQGDQGQQGGNGSDEGGSGGDDSGSSGDDSGSSGNQSGGGGSSGSSGDSGGQNGQGTGNGSNANQGSDS